MKKAMFLILGLCEQVAQEQEYGTASSTEQGGKIEFGLVAGWFMKNTTIIIKYVNSV